MNTLSLRVLERFRQQMVEVEAHEHARALQVATFPHMDQPGRERAMRDLRRRLGAGTFDGHRKIPKSAVTGYQGIGRRPVKEPHAGH